MANVQRANRDLDERARFGLGSDSQDDNTAPADFFQELTAQQVIENGFSSPVFEDLEVDGTLRVLGLTDFEDSAVALGAEASAAAAGELQPDYYTFADNTPTRLYITQESTGEANYTGAPGTADEWSAVHARIDYVNDDPSGSGIGPYSIAGRFEMNFLQTDGDWNGSGPWGYGILTEAVHSSAVQAGGIFGIDASARVTANGDGQLGGITGVSGGIFTQAGSTAAIASGSVFSANAFLAGGTVTDLYGFFFTLNNVGATITNSYGIWMPSQLAQIGTTINRAIQTEGGTVEHRTGLATATGMIQRGFAAQSANLHEWSDANGVPYGTVTENGYFTTRKTSAPADAELAAGEVAFWWDATDGDGKFMIKGKTANGTVETASVPTA